MRSLWELFEEIQFGLSGHLANCPIDSGLVPEQPFIKKMKKMNDVEIFLNSADSSFSIKIFSRFMKHWLNSFKS